MTLNIPDDAKELENKSLVDLQQELPDTANPFLEESWMGAQGRANARRVFDFYTQLRILEQECIPVTADEKLELWASYWGIVRNPATQSNGNVIATGSAGSVIPQGTSINSSDGVEYTTADDVTITDAIVSITSLTRSGNIATAVLASDQPLYSGQTVTIAGADQTEYNGVQSIAVTGSNEFTYEVSGSPSTPATGTITAEITAAVLSVQSVAFQNSAEGIEVNQEPNTRLTFSTPLAGVDNAVFVDQGAIGGGTDTETNEELRARLLDRVQNPVANFNSAAIVAQAKTVPGVTDVFVFEITPDVGQVTIYFTRGNDDSPIPDASEVQPVKDAILEIKPANTADDDVIVLAPTGVNTQFNFTAIEPNDSETRDRVTANLEALFLDEAVVVGFQGASASITEEQYGAAIVNAGVISFTLDTPAGDIGSTEGEYAVFTGADFP